MMQTQASVPSILIRRGNTLLENALAVILGVTMLSLLAQVAIPLPWTPVPITGQTFGVTLIALTWGGLRAPMVVALYLALGASGAPVFANGLSGITWGPTLGYLIGMLIGSGVIGRLADRGWTKTFKGALAAGFIGSAIVYTSGLLVLSQFVSGDALFMAGMIPFIPGDIIKTSLAAWIASNLTKKTASSSSK